MICPRSSTGATRRRAPFSLQSICHGTMLAWCSSQLMTISSPALDVARPQLCATRLMASVAPRTKTMSRGTARYETANALARRLVRVGGARRERVRGAMDVRVLVLVEVRDAIDDGLRLLGRRRVVEPDELLAVDVLVEDRELALERMRVERVMAERAHRDVGRGRELVGLEPDRRIDAGRRR